MVSYDGFPQSVFLHCTFWTKVASDDDVNSDDMAQDGHLRRHLLTTLVCYEFEVTMDAMPLGLGLSKGFIAMTTPEHTLVGIHLAFATGIHRWVGWRGVVLAGVASNLPDWDGLPMLFDMQRFESGHRVWGHSMSVMLLTAILFGLIENRWDLVGWIATRIRKWISSKSMADWSGRPSWVLGTTGVCVLASICLLAQLLHLPCDMVVSGGDGLSDWAVQPWWPFSNVGYVFPLIPWGDVGPTVILMAGVIVIAKRKLQISLTAWGTILILIGYLVIRGWSRGAFSGLTT